MNNTGWDTFAQKKYNLEGLSCVLYPRQGPWCLRMATLGCDSRCSASCYYGHSVSNQKPFHRARRKLRPIRVAVARGLARLKWQSKRFPTDEEMILGRVSGDYTGKQLWYAATRSSDTSLEIHLLFSSALLSVSYVSVWFSRLVDK